MKRLYGAWYVKFNHRWYYCGSKAEALARFGALHGK
jgi:hypothetical protein